MFPRLRRKPKKLKPVMVDIDKLAKREDIESINKKLGDAKRQKLLDRVARLSPRQKRKLAKIIAEQKGV